jgi:hypothetical protein
MRIGRSRVHANARDAFMARSGIRAPPFPKARRRVIELFFLFLLSLYLSSEFSADGWAVFSTQRTRRPRSEEWSWPAKLHLTEAAPDRIRNIILSAVCCGAWSAPQGADFGQKNA